jgi:ribonuclease HII
VKQRFCIGIDEVGRGPLAGPVTVCALLVPEQARKFFVGNFDSKQLSAKKRAEIYRFLKQEKASLGIDFEVVSIASTYIDTKGIVPAIDKALTKALKVITERNNLPTSVKILLDGGLRAPGEFTNQTTIIRGDSAHFTIGLASICAKETRDAYMKKIESKYPGYGFARNCGYGTLEHRKAIGSLGTTPIHRKSFLRKLTELV